MSIIFQSPPSAGTTPVTVDGSVTFQFAVLITDGNTAPLDIEYTILEPDTAVHFSNQTKQEYQQVTVTASQVSVTHPTSFQCGAGSTAKLGANVLVSLLQGGVRRAMPMICPVSIKGYSCSGTPGRKAIDHTLMHDRIVQTFALDAGVVGALDAVSERGRETPANVTRAMARGARVDHARTPRVGSKTVTMPKVATKTPQSKVSLSKTVKTAKGATRKNKVSTAGATIAPVKSISKKNAPPKQARTSAVPKHPSAKSKDAIKRVAASDASKRISGGGKRRGQS